MWIFTSRTFRLVLQITFLLNKYFLTALSEGTPIRDPRVCILEK